MKIGIIGYGNIGRAFSKGLINKDFAKKSDIYVYDVNENCVLQAQSEGYTVVGSLEELYTLTDIVLTAVKGYVFEDICKNSNTSLLSGKTLISTMAGESIEKMHSMINADCEIIRVMPTLAMANNKGITGITPTDNEYVKNMFSVLGYSFTVEEKNIECVTAYSGCGLGFAAYLLDSYVKAGIDIGFDEETSLNITKLIFESALDMGEYADTVKRVSTKGGATEQGVEFMNENKVDKLISDTVLCAYKKFGK